MNKKRTLNYLGVTLIELLIVMVMMGLVATAMFSVYQDTGRSSRTEDEVVELQQMLRTAIDQISSDIRMAGFVVSKDVAPLALAQPERMSGGAIDPYPAAPTAPVNAMHFLMRTASAQACVARITEDAEVSTAAYTFPVSADDDSASQFAQFETDHCARVYRSATSEQPAVPPKNFTVTLVTAGGAPTGITLTTADNSLMSNVIFKQGDLIARIYGAPPCTATPAGLLPEYVGYATYPIPALPFLAAGTLGTNNRRSDVALDAAIAIIRHTGACKTEQCFPHNATNVSEVTGSRSSIGTQAELSGTTYIPVSSDTNIPRITRLNFSYLLNNDTEQNTVPDAGRGTTSTSTLNDVVAVRVTVTGQTPTGKRRELSTVVRLLNRGVRE